MGSGGTDVISGLAGSQKNMSRLLYRYLSGQDPGALDPGHPNQGSFGPYNSLPLFQGATPYGWSVSGVDGSMVPGRDSTRGGGTYPITPGSTPGQASGPLAGHPGAQGMAGGQLQSGPAQTFNGQPMPGGIGPNAPGTFIPGQRNANTNPLLQQTQDQMLNQYGGLNPRMSQQYLQNYLEPSMQGQQSRSFTPLSAPDRLKLGQISTPGPLNLQQQKAGPNLNMPNLQQLPQFNYQQQKAGPQVNAQKITPDLGYKYDPFQHQNIDPNTGKATDTYNFKPGSVKSTLDNAGNTQRYFQEGVMNPLLRQYDTAIAPRIADQMSAAGNTFSTRAQTARQMALGDLQTQATSQLSSAVRQDEIERSQQNLNAQQFNVGTQTQNAQFGGQLQQGYDLANMQRALGIAQTNEANRMTSSDMNNTGRLNEFNQRNQNILQAGNLNNQFNMQAQQINNQDRQFNQNLNTSGALNAYQANMQNALGFGQLNTQRQLGAAEINNQNNQYYSGLNQQGQLAQYGMNSQNALNFGQLNSQNQLQQQQINNQSGQAYDFFNQNMQTQLSEAARNRQLQAVGMTGDQLNSMYGQYGQMAGMGGMMQGLDQGNLDRTYQDFLRTAPENSPWLQMATNLLGQNQGNVVRGQPGTMDQIAGGAGIAASLLPLLGMLL